jgi:hypothetical protein
MMGAAPCQLPLLLRKMTTQKDVFFSSLLLRHRFRLLFRSTRPSASSAGPRRFACAAMRPCADNRGERYKLGERQSSCGLRHCMWQRCGTDRLDLDARLPLEPFERIRLPVAVEVPN